ncbi:MAG TPA: TIR domain-containing protein [Verrucomicrobiales bacterium]|nr:TIR domain-containing protein [Verrucomicrobiales bacterium]
MNSDAAAHGLSRRFHVALSFPGTKRTFVRSVAQVLEKALGRERVFYDNWYKDELAAPDLDLVLENIYHNESELIVLFISRDYGRRNWCGLEWRQMRVLLLEGEGHRLMTFRFDDESLEGLSPIDGYVRISEDTTENREAESTVTPDDVAELILRRLRTMPSAFADAAPKLERTAAGTNANSHQKSQKMGIIAGMTCLLVLVAAAWVYRSELGLARTNAESVNDIGKGGGEVVGPAGDYVNLLKAAVRQLRASSYTWTSTPESSPGGGSSTVIRGKVDKENTVLEQWMEGSRISRESIRRGDKSLVKTEKGWISSRPTAGAAKGNRSGGWERVKTGSTLPEEDVMTFVAGVKKWTKEGDVFAGELTADAARVLDAGQPANTAANPLSPFSDFRGSAKVWLRNGALAKYEFVIDLKFTSTAGTKDVQRKRTIVISSVGTTSVEIPGEAAALLR